MIIAGDMNTTGLNGNHITLRRLLVDGLRSTLFGIWEEGSDGKSLTSKGEDFILNPLFRLTSLGPLESPLSLQKRMNIARNPVAPYSPEYAMFKDIAKAGFFIKDKNFEYDRLLFGAHKTPFLRQVPLVPLLGKIPGPGALFKKKKNTERALGDTNKRSNIYFAPTFELGYKSKLLKPISYLLANKVDWIFSKNSEDTTIIYSNPEVLKRFNNSFKKIKAVTYSSGKLSDHHPITVEFEVN